MNGASLGAVTAGSSDIPGEAVVGKSAVAPEVSSPFVIDTRAGAASSAILPSSPAVTRDESRFSSFELDLTSFISFPFVLSPATKAAVLECDANLQMRRGMDQEIQQAIMAGQRYVTPYFVLRVSRERIVLDTLSQIMLYEESDFKKPLKVVFDDEDGVDAGGVRKEYYQVQQQYVRMSVRNLYAHTRTCIYARILSLYVYCTACALIEL